MREPTETRKKSDLGLMSRTDTMGKIAENIWTWIGIFVVLGLYALFYMQLPDWVQLWIDPRLFGLGIFIVLVMLVSVFRAIRTRIKSAHTIDCE